jgi:hypothetical protein
MKKRILPLLLISFLFIITVDAQNNTKKTPVGNWKFEAPYAPEGYTSGSVVVGYAEKKYTTTMEFASGESKLAGEKVKFLNDSLFFSVFIQGQDVAVKLKMDEGTKMTGKAVYSEGEVPLTLLKIAVEVKSEIKK